MQKISPVVSYIEGIALDEEIARSARSLKLWAGIPSRSRLSQGLVEFLEGGDIELDTGPICGSPRATPIPEDRLANLYGVTYDAYKDLREKERELVQEARAEERVPWQKPARYGADCLVMGSGQQVTAYRAYEHGDAAHEGRSAVPARRRQNMPEVVSGFRLRSTG